MSCTAVYGRIEKIRNLKNSKKNPRGFPLGASYSTAVRVCVCVCVCVCVFLLNNSHSTAECVCNQGREEKQQGKKVARIGGAEYEARVVGRKGKRRKDR